MTFPMPFRQGEVQSKRTNSVVFPIESARYLMGLKPHSQLLFGQFNQTLPCKCINFLEAFDCLSLITLGVRKQ